MNTIEEIQSIEEKLVDLRIRYKTSKPNRRKFIEVLGKALKDKQKRLRDSLSDQLTML